MRSSFARAAILFSLALLSCSKPAQQPTAKTAAPNVPLQSQPIEATPQPIPAAESEDQVLIAVSKALRDARLLTRPDPCYAYRYDPAPTQPTATVDVRENHNHPECGGDPATQPHLFTVRVDKRTHALTQDAHVPGDFQPLAR